MSREARPRKLTFYCFGSLWEMMRPQSPGPPAIPLSKVSSASTFSLSVSLRKPATRPSLSPCTSGFYLLTGFQRGPSSRPSTDSTAPTFFGASPEAQLPLFFFFDWVAYGAPIFPRGTLNCLVSSHCLLFSFFPSFAALCGLCLLVPQPQIESQPLAVKVWHPNHSTCREFPVFSKYPLITPFTLHHWLLWKFAWNSRIFTKVFGSIVLFRAETFLFMYDITGGFKILVVWPLTFHPLPTSWLSLTHQGRKWVD